VGRDKCSKEERRAEDGGSCRASVFASRISTPENDQIVAFGRWDAVQNVAGELVEKTDRYPVRFRVRQFPSPEQLEQIGNFIDEQ